MTPSNDIVIRVSQLIDATGAGPVADAALRIADGRIAYVGPYRDLPAGGAAEVLDYSGHTALPGLIDSHCHLTFNAGPDHETVRRAVATENDERLAMRAVGNAQAHLAGGVTALRDCGGRGFVTLAVRDAIREGLVLGPRVAACGPAITCTDGHLNYLLAIADDAEAVRSWAQAVCERGGDFVKICATGGLMTAESDPIGPQYTADELRGAVEVAAEHGRIVAAHVLGTEGLSRSVEAGVQSIEHCMFQHAVGEFEFLPELAARMARQGAVAGLTFAGLGQTRYRQERLGRTSAVDMGPWVERFKRRYESERALIAAGVKYTVHSDAGVRETPFGEFWMSLAAMQFELGITPMETLIAATHTPAELLGWGDEIGTLEVGKRGDFLIVLGDPLEDLAALRSPAAVFLGGRRVAEGGELRLRVGSG